jgi:hypothetical protein
MLMAFDALFKSGRTEWSRRREGKRSADLKVRMISSTDVLEGRGWLSHSSEAVRFRGVRVGWRKRKRRRRFREDSTFFNKREQLIMLGNTCKKHGEQSVEQGYDAVHVTVFGHERASGITRGDGLLGNKSENKRLSHPIERQTK